MFISRISFIIAAILVPTLCIGETVDRISAKAIITAVTVYQDRAQILRNATVSLRPGTSVVSIENLPVLLQDDSIRVEGVGTAGVVISGIEVKRKFLEQVEEKLAKELEAEIRQLERRSGILDSRRIGLASQKAFFESIRVAWGDRISKELAIGKPTSAELLDASSFVSSGVSKVEEQFRDIDFEKRQIKEKIDALKRRQNEATGSRRKEGKSVEVTLEVSRGGNFTINLFGVVNRAGWEPAYDVRLAPDAGSAELVFRAQVRQQTGEDWKNVALTLSTARPAAGGAPPEITPWHISIRRPMPAPMAMPSAAPRREALYKKAARMSMEMEDNSVGAAIPEAQPEEAAFRTARLDTDGNSVSFRIPKPVDVSADGSQQGSVIAIDKLPVTSEYVAVPKLSPSVYLKAELVNRANYPLMPGQIRIFTGNTFTGTSTMKRVAMGEKFTLPFGSDDQITVKREEQKQHKEAGLFGSNRMLYQYKIEVNNFRKEPQSITVREQLPLADDSEIKVGLEGTTLQPDEKKRDGQLEWKLKLAPGEKKEFSYGILVEYPKDREVSGL